MRYLSFTKMAGAGNDFIIIDNRSGAVSNPSRLARRLTNRRLSVGADGLLLLERSRKADVRMRIFNPDGTQAPMCGNGVRCLARFAADRKIAGPGLSIQTSAGIIRAEVRRRSVKVKMPEPRDLRLHVGLRVNGHRQTLSFINTGVPHAVKAVASLDRVDVCGLGRTIRFHRRFAPRGTNVDFVAVGLGRSIGVRTYERGVEAETPACGTGAVASALVAAALRGLRSPVSVRTRGGERLKVYFSKKGPRFRDVYLEGRVRKCFEGRVSA